MYTQFQCDGCKSRTAVCTVCCQRMIFAPDGRPILIFCLSQLLVCVPRYFVSSALQPRSSSPAVMQQKWKYAQQETRSKVERGRTRRAAGRQNYEQIKKCDNFFIYSIRPGNFSFVRAYSAARHTAQYMPNRSHSVWWHVCVALITAHKIILAIDTWPGNRIAYISLDGGLFHSFHCSTHSCPPLRIYSHFISIAARYIFFFASESTEFHFHMHNVRAIHINFHTVQL